MNKFKYIATVLLVFAVSFIGGCCGMDLYTSRAEAVAPKVMNRVSIDTGLYSIYEDTRTGVQYLSTSSGVCMMRDEYGNPYVEGGAQYIQ